MDIALTRKECVEDAKASIDPPSCVEDAKVSVDPPSSSSTGGMLEPHIDYKNTRRTVDRDVFCLLDIYSTSLNNPRDS
jgi:hypothetical protein